MKKLVLLVDDEKLNLEFGEKLLVASGHDVITAVNGAEALKILGRSKVDLVVTDAQMPEFDGFQLCQIIKRAPETTHIPVIIITNYKTSVLDAMFGYEQGADDYITKPCDPRLLAAKINAVLKRYAPATRATQAISALGIKLDPNSRTVTVARRPVKLTRKEFDLLLSLLHAKGRVLSNTNLLETVWGYDPAQYNDPHTVKTHVSSLRKKLGNKIGAHIISVTGHGYKFE